MPARLYNIYAGPSNLSTSYVWVCDAMLTCRGMCIRKIMACMHPCMHIIHIHICPSARAQRRQVWIHDGCCKQPPCMCCAELG